MGPSFLYHILVTIAFVQRPQYQTCEWVPHFNITSQTHCFHTEATIPKMWVPCFYITSQTHCFHVEATIPYMYVHCTGSTPALTLPVNEFLQLMGKLKEENKKLKEDNRALSRLVTALSKQVIGAVVSRTGSYWTVQTRGYNRAIFFLIKQFCLKHNLPPNILAFNCINHIFQLQFLCSVD